MAGDWLKIERSLSDKPEVWAIAATLDIDPDAVVGKLVRVWGWFDEQTEEGNAPSVTKMLLDRRVGVTGFCDAMTEAGWMDDDGQTITLPNFDRHNGKTAKNRALTAKRVANHKKKSNGKANAKDNAPSVTTALPREEKSREEDKPPCGPPKKSDSEKPRKPKRLVQLPKDFKPDKTAIAKANELSVDLDTELEKFCNHAQATARTAKDWQAAFRNWLIKAAEFRQEQTNGKASNRDRPKSATQRGREGVERYLRQQGLGE